MKKGKFEKKAQRRIFGSKSLALILAVILLIGGAVGGTVAWLTATSDEVTNTFSTSNIGVKLEESKNLDLKMIPGWEIKKDPKASVTADSEDCYLFVELTKSDNYGAYLEEYEIAEGWTELVNVSTTSKVYYRIFDSKNAANTNVKGSEYPILKGDKVTVKGSVTMEQMETAKTNPPTLTLKAYASQLYQNATTTFTAEQAWSNVKPATP